MKNNIAVITFFNSDANYGQTLQAHAVLSMIKKCDCNGVIINYNPRTRSEYLAENLTEKLTAELDRRLRYSKASGSDTKIYELFDEYIDKYMSVSNPCLTKTDVTQEIISNDCNAIVCGSDQIWNLCVNEEDDIFYANFPTLWRIPKISFAASFGINKVYNDELTKLKNIGRLVDRFSYISVREEAGRKYLQQFTDKEIRCLIDPVLMLEADEWIQFERQVKLPDHYILAYFIGETGSKLEEITRLYPGREVVYIHELLDGQNNIGPAEFLYYIRNADAVVGDSYHSAAFSIEFEKPFYMYHRTDSRFSGYDRDDRVNNMLTVLGIGNRYIDTGVIEEIDYSKVLANLELEREKANNFLSKALGDTYEG